MRIIGTIPNSQYRIVLYDLEKHFYTEFEAGPMKQGFKWPKSHLPHPDAVKLALDQAFLEKVKQRFDSMYADMAEILKERKDQ